MKQVLTTISLMLLVYIAFGQTNCYFKPDQQKILSNQNLDFFTGKFLSDTFKIGKNKKDIPGYIRDQFTCLAGDSFLADPGDYWAADGPIPGVPSLPTRQLLFFAQSKDVFIISYFHGGPYIETRLVFMRFSGKTLVDTWSGIGDCTCRNIKCILSYINENKKKKGRLNSDALYY